MSLGAAAKCGTDPFDDAGLTNGEFGPQLSEGWFSEVATIGENQCGDAGIAVVEIHHAFSRFWILIDVYQPDGNPMPVHESLHGPGMAAEVRGVKDDSSFQFFHTTTPHHIGLGDTHCQRRRGVASINYGPIRYGVGMLAHIWDSRVGSGFVRCLIFIPGDETAAIDFLAGNTVAEI